MWAQIKAQFARFKLIISLACCLVCLWVLWPLMTGLYYGAMQARAASAVAATATGLAVATNSPPMTAAAPAAAVVMV